MPASMEWAGMTEAAFAVHVDAMRGDPAHRRELLALLEESHPAYEQRGAAAVVRMRGWVLLACAAPPVPAELLVFLLEELESGNDAYLVAVAAHALRSAERQPAFAGFLARAVTNLWHHDDVVSLETYGGVATGDGGTSPDGTSADGASADGTSADGMSADGMNALAHVFRTLRWLGADARAALPTLEARLAEDRDGTLPHALRAELRATIAAIGATAPDDAGRSCCDLPSGMGHQSFEPACRRAPGAVAGVAFEDHDRRAVAFTDYFRGKPSIAAFFYTRCDNPRKCSLTIAKLGWLQRRLRAGGLADRVRLAAITYDPGWDTPDRMRGYARSRSVELGEDCRMLRCADADLPAVRSFFGAQVNWIESLVNRHRVEAVVLDAHGRVAARFDRLAWDESDVIACAEQLVDEASAAPPERAGSRATRPFAGVVAPVAAIAAAALPKCAMCWAVYASALGIAGLERLPLLPWLRLLLAAMVAVNLVALWRRSRTRGSPTPFLLGVAGVAALGVGLSTPLAWCAPVGVGLTMAASLAAAIPRAVPRMTAP